MKRLVAATAALVLGGWGLDHLLSSQGSPAPCPRTAVVDMAKVFQEYRKCDDLDRELENQIQARKDKIAEDQKRLEELKKERATLRPGSDDYAAKQEEIINLETRLDAQQRNYNQELEERYEAYWQEILRDVTAEVEAYAAIHKYALVLQKGLVIREKAWNSVVYCEAALDITDELVDLLNKRYQKG